MDKQTEIKLIEKALQMRSFSYVPYSHFSVGAALLASDGKIFTGCNIENAAFSPTNCAERTAFFKAVSEGVKSFKAIAVCGGTEGKDPDFITPPCGMCRQVMREFCSPEDFTVILAQSTQKYKVFKLKDLLPESFGPEFL